MKFFAASANTANSPAHHGHQFLLSRIDNVFPNNGVAACPQKTAQVEVCDVLPRRFRRVSVPAHADLQRELDQRLAALMKRHGDEWRFNSSELVEEGSRLYRYATFYTLDEYRFWAKANPDKAK